MDVLVDRIVREFPERLLFITVSGAHLYGFPSPDSDIDLRGVHVLRPESLLGLRHGPATIERMEPGPPEVDLVTHDAAKFFRLLLRPNGYVLEQLYSPLIEFTTPQHTELKDIAKACISRLHMRHYRGFAENQWRLFDKERPRRVKPLLYVFRVLLAGIHLMRTGVVEANLVTLNQEMRLNFIDELIERKVQGTERGTLADSEVDSYRLAYEGLLLRLHSAAEASHLPDAPGAEDALNDLLLRLRRL